MARAPRNAALRARITRGARFIKRVAKHAHAMACAGI